MTDLVGANNATGNVPSSPRRSMPSQVSTSGKIDEGFREHMICNREAYLCIHSMHRYSVDLLHGGWSSVPFYLLARWLVDLWYYLRLAVRASSISYTDNPLQRWWVAEPSRACQDRLIQLIPFMSTDYSDSDLVPGSTLPHQIYQCEQSAGWNNQAEQPWIRNLESPPLAWRDRTNVWKRSTISCMI